MRKVRPSKEKGVEREQKLADRKWNYERNEDREEEIHHGLL